MHPTKSTPAKGVWTSHEHERFLEAIALYPHGPWTLITEHIGTRSAKQVQTHAQKYQHKLLRHERGLLKRKTKSSRLEHRVDQTTADHLRSGFIARPAQRFFSGSSVSPHRPNLAQSHLATVNEEPKHEAMRFNYAGHAGLHAPPPFTYSPAPSTCTSQSEYSDTDSAYSSSWADPELDALLDGIEPVPFAPPSSTPPVATSGELDERGSWNALDFLLVCGLLARGGENGEIV